MTSRRKSPLNPLLLARARAMRCDPAPAEAKLWSCLRNRLLGGFKFRRQVPLGAFIADFYCHEVDLIVELDGESHLHSEKSDQIRTEVLERAGHAVIRFWNPDVFTNLQAVLEAIYAECERRAAAEHPHPDPLPEGEGASRAAAEHPHPDPLPEGEGVRRAIEILSRGGVVAFPTETVYGLGADATNSRAVRRIFEVKGRPSTNPLIVHVADESVARRYAREWPPAASRLVARFWPGPLTLVAPKHPSIVPEVTAGLDTVGLRAPDHPLALELLRAFNGPLAGPSANRSSHVSPTTAGHVHDEFGDEIDLILDGGPCQVGIESTVLDLTSDPPRIVRPGAVTREQIEAMIGAVELKRIVTEATTPAIAPGQHERHYAPRTPAFRVEPHEISQLDLRDAALLDLTVDPETYARHFYARLRMLDQQNLRAIYIVMPPDLPQWLAIRDRITRATRPMPHA